jgi:hypothetical protein
LILKTQNIKRLTGKRLTVISFPEEPAMPEQIQRHVVRFVVPFGVLTVVVKVPAEISLLVVNKVQYKTIFGGMYTNGYVIGRIDEHAHIKIRRVKCIC